MYGRTPLSKSHVVDIMTMWNNNEMSMADMSKKYKVTRQCIYKILKKAGCDVSKRRIPVSCNTCGKEIIRTRKQIRTRKRIFCSVDCYRAWFASISQYDTSNYGSRVAREKVRQYFDLQEGNIVHHINGHGLDNDLDNLVVYRNQGDHLRAHRGFDAEPIWIGKDHKYDKVI